MADAALAALRLAQFASASALGGGPALLRLTGAEGRGARPALAAAGAVLALAALAVVPVQTLGMAGSLGADDLRYVALETGLGVSALLRAGLAAAAVGWLLAHSPGPRTWSVAAALGLAATATLAWSGHAGATPGALGAAHLAADLVHLLAAALWLGALAPLLAWSLRARPGPAGDRLAAALHRFSGVGTALVAALAASGLVNAAILVGPAGVPRLPQSAYGRWLLLKLALFAGMLLLAALNRWRLTPALAAGQDSLPRLRASLWAETALGVGVLAAVSVMGVLAPTGHEG